MQEHQFKVLGYAIGVVLYVLYIIFDFFLDGEEGQPTRLVCGSSCSCPTSACIYMLECHIYSLVLFHPYTQVRLVLVCIGAVINFPLAIAVWWKMGSLAFSKVGSNKQLVRKLYIYSGGNKKLRVVLIACMVNGLPLSLHAHCAGSHAWFL